MAIKMVAMKCPQCGADLEIDPTRKTIFCNYCGAKILIQNDNEYVFHYRTTDDADVERAETDRMVKKHQIELSRMRAVNKGKKFRFKVQVTVILGIIGLVMITIGILGGESLEGFGVAGAWAFLAIALIWILGMDKDDDEEYDISDRAKVPDSIDDFESKNYKAVESILRSAGFNNIKCIGLNDLTTGLLKKPGLVESITINGHEVECGGKKYSKNADVIISYHSFAGK